MLDTPISWFKSQNSHCWSNFYHVDQPSNRIKFHPTAELHHITPKQLSQNTFPKLDQVWPQSIKVWLRVGKKIWPFDRDKS